MTVPAAMSDIHSLTTSLSDLLTRGATISQQISNTPHLLTLQEELGALSEVLWSLSSLLSRSSLRRPPPRELAEVLDNIIADFTALEEQREEDVEGVTSNIRAYTLALQLAIGATGFAAWRGTAVEAQRQVENIRVELGELRAVCARLKERARLSLLVLHQGVFDVDLELRETSLTYRAGCFIDGYCSAVEKGLRGGFGGEFLR